MGTERKPRIMYIECKQESLLGPARIGRVSFSKTRITLYYGGKAFERMKNKGGKANYFKVGTGEEYWISGPKHDGNDRLYRSNIPVHIDEDVRDEYWTEIRQKPALKDRNTT